MRKKVLSAGFMLLGLAVTAPRVSAQDRKPTFEDVVKRVEARFEPAEARPGQTVTLKIVVELLPDWHTYPTVQPDPKAKRQTNRLNPPKPSAEGSPPDVIFVGAVENPPRYELASSENLTDGIQELREYPGGGVWEQKVVVSPEARPGTKKISFSFRMLVCKTFCFPPRNVPLEATLTVTGEKVEVEAPYRDEVARALASRTTERPTPVSPAPPRSAPPAAPTVTAPPSPGAAPPKPTASGSANPSPPSEGAEPVGFRIQADQNYQADLDAVGAQLDTGGRRFGLAGADGGSFVAFLLTAMFWGGVTLLTPCVFPMIPITVSFFLKQGEKTNHSPLRMASLYTATIVVVLGISAVTLLSVFRSLSVNPWMNIGLGVLFVFFALSLFGMYDIILPSSLVRFTSSREGPGSVAGTMFMAVSFTVVSFTCVAPFLGGFSGMAASGNFTHLQLALGGLAFAGTFAAPFFFLALFPAMLKKLPRSGSWLNTVKVAMGFLELAAALKFFRAAEVRWQSQLSLFSYDFVLAIWVGILVMMGLYLLNLYRLPHDEPQGHIGVPRMLFGLASVSLAVYLMPGVFTTGDDKPRPGGVVYAWVDSFLLPEQGKQDFVWSADLKAALEEARSNGGLVFVDFTGVTCTNCRLNENNVFPHLEVRKQLKKYRLVQLYTDTVPDEFYDSPPGTERQEEDAQANLEFQKKYFGTEQLPLYVILKPEPGSTKVHVVDVYDEGKINREARFIDFLKKPLQKK